MPGSLLKPPPTPKGRPRHAGSAAGPPTPQPPAIRPLPRHVAEPLGWVQARKLTLPTLGLGLLFAAAAIAATWRAWGDIWELSDIRGDNSHVLLVPLVVCWLAWVRRGRLPHVRVTGRWVGPLLILAGWSIAAWGLGHNRSSLFHLGSLAVVIGAFTSVCGKGVLLRFLPVAVAVLFVIPVPQLIRQELAVPLQTTTAWIAAGVLDVIGIETQLLGNTLLVNGRSVMIAEACNGMPMAFGLLLVTYAFAFAWPMRNGVRWLLLIMAPVVTLGCNVVRTVPLVWSYAYQPREAADWLHTWSGWAMLPVAFLLLLGLVRALRWFDIPVERYRLASQ